MSLHSHYVDINPTLLVTLKQIYFKKIKKKKKHKKQQPKKTLGKTYKNFRHSSLNLY